MIKEQIAIFLRSAAFGVVGASNKREKFGYKVFDCYREHGYQAIPVHPILTELDGIATAASVQDLPATVESLSVITPPKVTEQIVRDAVAKGIKNIWMQPGAESAAAVSYCQEHDVNVIAGGPCLLVELG